MKNKSIEAYLKIFKKSDIQMYHYLPLNEKYFIDELHTDFEIGITSFAKKLYCNIAIKYCIWHQKRANEKKKNILCKNDILNDDNIYALYNIVCILFYAIHHILN